jgi:hypothetical protein
MVSRGEGRVHREGDDAVGEPDFVILQTVALPAEHDSDGFAGGDTRCQLSCALLRRDHRLRLVMGAGGRHRDEVAVGNRRGQAVEKLGRLDHAVGAGGHHPRFRIGPGLLGRNKAQARQTEIRHHPRRGADVFAELRLDQNHDRRRLRDPGFRLVGSGARHAMALICGGEVLVEYASSYAI